MKKLIIVTAIIMLASCGTVKHTSAPAEGRSPRHGRTEKVFPSVDGSAGDVRSQNVPETKESQDPLILATLWYQKSSEMRALCYQCFRNAETALKENLALPGRTRPAAVVLDIDETLLDNSPFQGWQVVEKKPYNNEDWNRWVELARARPLPGAVEFTRYADSLGVEVFYVSNRTMQEMGPTIKNLAAWGFVNADSTHMLLKETTSSKAERRAFIEMNYEILLLIGDSLADHSDKYENRGPDNGFETVDTDRHLFGTRYIVLPNPMYGKWLDDLLISAPGSTEHERLVKLLESF